MPRPKIITEPAIRALYDGFEKKDMPFYQFRKELLDLLDPKKIMSDLGDIELRKARERMNKMRIERGVKRND